MEANKTHYFSTLFR